jgi:putative integral membrane protein (TIGR02587 family)
VPAELWLQARPLRPSPGLASNSAYAIGIARAFGGAVLFALPLLMTMEMWELGHSLERGRLLIFVLLDLGLLVGLSYYAGFERTDRLRDDVIDAIVSFAVGVLASTLVLALFGVLKPHMPLDALVGTITLQAIPASIGAAVARKQLGSRSGREEARERNAGYAGQLFLMLAGAVFLSFNVAPTEEMMLIAFKMSAWHVVGLVFLSLAALHAFVYAVGFTGQEKRPAGSGFTAVFLRYTVAGYVLALAVSFYVLWTFGRIESTALEMVTAMTVVLGFPSALGAAIARLSV